jgi:protocatechuate 3,4-dioxygenase, beta subunit
MTPTDRTARQRRGLLLAAGAAFVASGGIPLRAWAQAAVRQPTPAQTEGPFYPVELPADHDADLLLNGALRYTQGQPTWVEGTVSDLEGRPVHGAVVEIWQCDQQGHYHHPGEGNRADRAFQGFGRVAVDGQGRYRFRTIRPVAYGGRAPHIHVKVRLAARELLTTQLYVQGDAANASDFLWRQLPSDDERAALTVPFVAGTDGLQARFPIVIAA